MTSLAFLLFAFLCGSIPFSVWLGKLFLRQDVRQYGDGNPGATNVFRAGSKTVGALALMLDVAKGALPVGLAYHTFGIRGLPMVLIAIAPTLGHAFSPFLGFRGGKAVATVLGVWIGLTIWKASLAGVIGVVVGIVLWTIPGWAVMLGLAAILATLLIWLPDPLFLVVWVGETLILVWTHRADLRQRPRLRPWAAKILFPSRK
jgi:acyl phosphate:glycerol-3-phosphate acyltransferase